MTANPHPFVLLLTSLLAVVAAGMFTAVAWAAVRVWQGRALLPDWPDRPRIVPWNAVTVVAVILTWVVVNVSVSSVYLQLRPHRDGHLASPPARKTLPDKANSATKPGPSGPVKAADDPVFSFTEQMVLVSIFNGVLLVVLPFGLRTFARADWDDLGLTGESLARHVKLGSVAFLVITPVVMATNALAQRVWPPNKHPLEHMLREQASPGLVALAYLSAALLAPAAEELIFRGVIQGWLRRLVFNNGFGRKGRPSSLAKLTSSDPYANPEGHDPKGAFRPWWLPRIPKLWTTSSVDTAQSPPDFGFETGDSDLDGVRRSRGFAARMLPVVLTSLLFAAVHYQQMPAPVAIFPLAMVLGVLYETTGSLVPSLTLHALFNAFNTTLLLVALLAQTHARP